MRIKEGHEQKYTIPGIKKFSSVNVNISIFITVKAVNNDYQAASTK